ncbi:Crp/Fnr family transcriptional regulator [Sphingomonas sp. TDK1]|uniref:Crp/Fnr family transcriptional regulator n=1 Tax=Sphingomonas sp. TDK1 TaxID=453247 RepID=UPI0007D93263|nr:Crp/Fnr family transcriptional regulator [Sphingomonas sp. TDK1]OAN67153.1 Crp/Fnr family transcriptional regulator [Sphingomonas sp. TDK1]
MIERHLRKLRLRDTIDAAEEAALRGTIVDTVVHPAGRTIVRAGEELNYSTLLLDGLIGRYKDLKNGQRQITHVHVAGDFADLHGFTLKRLDHALLALTPCTIARASHTRLREITETLPHLTRMMWYSTNVDAAIHREWEVSLGRRSAIQRAAHLFCELHVRLGIVGLSDENGYGLAISQAELAECLGLTPVHVNRVLRELRERHLVEFRNGRVSFEDLPALRRLAEFDPGYLYLTPQPL